MRASNYTRVAAGEAETSIAGDRTITVYAIVCANTSASAETVLVEEKDGSTIIQTIRVPADDTKSPIKQPFLADNGLRITPGANTSVTVYHSSPVGGA